MIPDEELRARFAELKRTDAGGAPDYATIRARPRRASSRWRMIVPVVSVAAAALVVVWCGASSSLGTGGLHATAPAAPTTSSVSGLGVEARAVIGGETRRVDPAAGPLDFLLVVPEVAALTRTSGLDSNPIEGW